MPQLTPEQQFDDLKNRLMSTLKDVLTAERGDTKIIVHGVDVEDDKTSGDIRGQKAALLSEKTWSVPIFADISVEKGGKELDRKRVKVLDLPKTTDRYGYIVRGTEYQTLNQFRQKSGVYHRVTDDGRIEAQFNLRNRDQFVRGKPFKIDFDPETAVFKLKIKSSEIPAYHLLRASGLSDEDLEKSWGPEILRKNKEAESSAKTYKRFADVASDKKRNVVVTSEQVPALFKQLLEKTELLPETTERTLGKAYKKVEPDTLLKSTEALLGISRGKRETDDKNALEFMEIHSVEDLIDERLRRATPAIQKKLLMRLDTQKRKSVRGVIPDDLMQKEVHAFFNSSLSSLSEQTNPLEMVNGQLRTTIMGEQGGLKSEHAVSDESKLVNPSHLGFLDPIHTPECYDDRTDVFTFSGWKRWEDVLATDRLACRIDGRLEFHVPEAFHCAPYCGPMYGLHSPRINYLVTPNHRMFSRTEWGQDWRVERADEVHGKERIFTRTHEAYGGVGGERISLPTVTGNHSLKLYGGLPVEAWAEFLGWYLSEGSFTYKESKRYSTFISQSATANPECYDSIGKLLDQLPFAYREANGRGFKIESKQLADYVKQFGFCEDKFIPEDMFSVPTRAREKLLMSLLHGDGRTYSNRKVGTSYEQKVMTTSSPRLAADFERLAIGLGHSVSHKVYPDNREERYLDIHEIRLLRSGQSHIFPSNTEKYRYYVQHYEGLVFCATVPGGLLLVRRDGSQGFWSGNSASTGIALHLPLGVRKRGNDLVAHYRNAKTGERVELSPREVADSIVAFPDQYTPTKTGMKPIGKSIKATKGGDVVFVDPKQVNYILPSPRGVFDAASNMIPFLQNNQGNRAMTASRQQEQAVPLLHREAPLVQVRTDTQRTFEDILGSSASRYSPVTGTISEVKKDAVMVKDSKGKEHEVQVYRDFALAGHTLYDSDVKVKAGDKVKEGQLLADSTFTKGGDLALGTNLFTAYIPFKGLNFEDGIVISSSAAEKLTSVHAYRKDVKETVDTTTSKKVYLAHAGADFTSKQVEGIGDDGLVKPGTVVHEGDPLILMLRKPTKEAVGLFSPLRRGKAIKMKPSATTWDKSYPGTVTDVVRNSDGQITVYVKTEEPAQVGDKLVGRHGNKGIITRIFPDAEMPYKVNEKGEKRHVQIALNPIGVPGRINLGQVLETAAGKVAEKQGHTYKVQNFEPGKDYLASVKSDLKKAGLTDKETLFDPVTGEKFEQQVLVGNQYILKLKHQVDKKLSARSAGPGMPYNIHHSPANSSPSPANTMGELGLYALLAHGARENIHEMYAYKGNQRTSITGNDPFWDALRDGTPIPPPQTPFVYDKFLAYMNGMRVNVKKEGNTLQLLPFTEKQIKELAPNELKEPGLDIRGKDARPEPEGIFDERKTGGMEGKKWSHFKLSEPIPNPLFEDAIKMLTGMNAEKFASVVSGDVEVKGKRGGLAVEAMLKDIDVKKERARIEKKIEGSRGEARNKMHRQLRILKMLDDNKLDPTVYMMHSVPVIPPAFRPLTIKEDRTRSNADLNYLYKDLAEVNETLAAQKNAHIPAAMLKDNRKAVYDGVSALMGMGTGGSLTRDYAGIADLIAGKMAKKGRGQKEGSPKYGYFQKHIVQRKLDFSARSTIIPEPHMGLDEVGVPEDIAWKLYEPFIQRELVGVGYKAADAQKEMERRSGVAEKALTRAMGQRPILMKRDPVLHKFGVMAFNPRLIKGKAIEIHPLVTGGYGADFDGDAMSLYLPVTAGAVKEAARMYPSNNLFSPTTGNVQYAPGHEALLGLYLLSKPGQRKNVSFANQEAAASAVRAGKIKATDIVKIGGKETSVGKLQIEQHLPENLRESGKVKPEDWKVLDKKATGKLLTSVAKKHPEVYGAVVNSFKDLGNDHSYGLGFSIGLDDFTPVHTKDRDKLVRQANALVKKVNADRSLTAAQKEAKIATSLKGMGNQLDAKVFKHFTDHPTNISQMVDSGSRGDRNQLKQIVSTPWLMLDSKDRVVPQVVPKSYAEGMDVGSYWTTMHGARKGTIQKAQGTAEPGYLSKMLVNSSMDQLVTVQDCGTKQSIALKLDDADVTDRYLATATKIAGKSYAAGSVVTPDLVAAAKAHKVANLHVRSPLRCEADHGICQKCLGLMSEGHDAEIGTNIGVLAANSIGEPSVQLSMKVFHTGGLATGGKESRSLSLFDELKKNLAMFKTVPNAAPLSLSEGTVTAIKRAPQGGHNVTIGKTTQYVPEKLELKVKLRQKVEKGDALSEGDTDPRQLLALKGLRPVQDSMTNKLTGILHEVAPVRRRNVEVIVKTMTNLARVDDPGDHPDAVVGDLKSHSKMRAWNGAHPGKKPVQFTPELSSLQQFPLDMQEDWIARLNSNQLHKTLIEGSREGWKSNIHSHHPIPAIVYGTEFGKKDKAIKPGETWTGQY